MKQIFLKFQNKSQADSFVEPYKENRDFAYDMVGEILNSPGYHVNMLVPDDFQSSYQVFPVTPTRTFAGW